MHAKRVCEYLDVLGNGSQAKPYLRVTDRAAGILYALDHALQKDEERLAVYKPRACGRDQRQANR